ncbi:uncharacterized protein A1O5_08927 [Cladophialophora psammophila CBS 110553]|uniref:Zn(2)-C6 fungal-type domain-containing protein n=1 Tax=Cladophialophora psammophila CBS 110553 TaxID=1182543 RepID=W9WJL1_9EURO|nr:uncharacterized protein A1O5_08927 [Cladophialophora psammophila CBS 110553]EXJ68312.1 hypothetical protein A1O5_08927 [Cladophialophora psammophila CBS 110553]
MTLPDSTTTVTTKPGLKRLACNFCRRKKIRCNGGSPCTNCLDHNEVCMKTTKRRPRKSKGTEDVDARLLRLESLLQMMHKPGELDSAAEQPSSVLPSSVGQNASQRNEAGSGHSSLSECTSWVNTGTISQAAAAACSGQIPVVHKFIVANNGGTSVSESPMATFNSQADTPHQLKPGPSRPEPQQLPMPDVSRNTRPSSSPIDSRDLRVCNSDGAPQRASPNLDESFALLERDMPSAEEGGSVYSGETTNWEYHGPRSWLSICSKPGVQWVMEKVGNSSFQDAASAFTEDITRRLKIDIDISGERHPDPSPETAWAYTRAYFDEANEAVFGIVHRPWLESKLQAHLANPSGDDDPVWYALRNAIFATGCRIVLSRTESFSKAKREAWRYFQNALSMNVQLLYLRTSLMSVQAMTIMTAYTGSIGSPCLEYMMCATAVRLACSKGLHREPPVAWNLSHHEACHRNWVFWAIYCLERQIVSRSGRPPMIDDDDISCQVPCSAPGGGFLNINYCQISIKLAQWSSLASRRISTKDVSRKGPQAFAGSIREINEQLASWCESIKGFIDFNSDIGLSRLPEGLTLQQTVQLYFSYYNLVLEIQSTLILPWSKALFNPTDQEVLRPEFEKSAEIAVEVCRKAILTTKHVRINADVSDSVAFHGPMNALMHLFIHVLERPHLPTARSDLALIDFGAGHFARLEYDTNSEYCVPFARSIANLARLAVERTNRTPLPTAHDSLPYQGPEMITDSSLLESLGLEDNFQMDMDPPLGRGSSSNAFDLELDNWSALLPIFAPTEGLAAFT